MLSLADHIKFNIAVLLVFFLQLPVTFAYGADEKVRTKVCAAVLKDFPPLYQVNGEGEPEGFAIDLLEKIAIREDIDISYKVVENWAEALELIRTGEADIVPGIGKSKVRQEEFAFTDEMESVPLSCFVKYGNKKITGIESLNNTDMVIGVIIRSVAQTKLESMGGYNLKLFESLDSALNQLLSGGIDAFVFPEPVLRKKLSQMTISDKVFVVGDPLMFLNRGYMMAKSNDELLSLFNNALDSIMRDPFYAGLYSKWYGSPKEDSMPVWILPLIGILALLIFIVMVFNVLLRHQVKKRADEIQAGHKYLDNLLETAECSILLLNEDLTIKYSNPYVRHLFGYSEEEMTEKNAIKLLVPEIDLEGAQPQELLIASMKNRDRVISNINQNITKDGKYLWMVWTNNFVDNVITGKREIISFGIDITLQKEAEEKLRQTQQELEVILDNMAGGMIYLDNDLNIMRVNKETERITGLAQEQIIGRKCYDVMCQAEVPCKDCSALKAMDTGVRSRNETFLLLNGKNYDVISTPIKDTHDNVAGTISILSDVTRRRKLEGNLKNAHEALERYSRALENKVEAGNLKLEKREEDLRQTQNQLIQAEKMASLGRLIAGIGHEINSPLGAIRSSGEIIHHAFSEFPSLFEALVSWLTSDDSDLFYEMLNDVTSNIMMDLSSRDRRDRRNSLMNGLEEIGVSKAYELAHLLVDMGLSDEIIKYQAIFKHPDVDRRMQIIQSFSQVHNGTNIISWAVERAHNIVYALKNYIHTSSAVGMVPVNIKESISMVLMLYQNQIKHGVEVELELDGLPDIMGYADGLNQIWSNLISNALQAMEYHGNLTIKGSIVEDNIVLSFIDTGCGIPDEIKETIFEPMFTTKPAGEGTGIGLDIVSKIVKKHNGIISTESQPGEGAAFVVSLPISQETSETGGAV